MPRTERIDLRVYEHEKREWEDMAQKHGISISELIRQSIENYKRLLTRLEK